jgi:hypothetical protein
MIYFQKGHKARRKNAKEKNEGFPRLGGNFVAPGNNIYVCVYDLTSVSGHIDFCPCSLLLGSCLFM